jgi:hypothetical protein
MDDSLLLIKIDSIIYVFICAVVVFNYDIDSLMHINSTLQFSLHRCNPIANSKFDSNTIIFKIIPYPFGEECILVPASHHEFLI